MYVIQSFEKYFIRDMGNFLEEIYDLDSATIFKTKKEANDVIKESTYEEYLKIIPYKPAKKKYDEWKSGGMIRRQLFKIDEKISRKYNEDPPEEVIRFYIYNYENENRIRYGDYKTWPQLYSLYKTLFAVQRYTNNEYTESWITIQIGISKDVMFADFKDEIDIALKYVTYMDDDFYKLSIIDHELSRFESRYLYINKNKDLCKIINHRDNVLFEGTLEECFNKIKRDFYHE